MTIIKDEKVSNAGSKIFLAGIAIQAVSFVLFTVMWGVFAYRVYVGVGCWLRTGPLHVLILLSRYQDQILWNRPGWKPLHWALGFTCIPFIIRSIFRTIELSQG